MKCGHLFNGIGGFPLAASWMGWQNIMHCEIDPFCNRVMKHHFPNSYQHEDIRTTDFTIWRGRIDLLTGGFPCQPYSTGGKRLGTADDRHLWPEMLRAIREISPRWIVGENVRGLVNWNKGVVFDEVQADMEAAGYEVLPFLLPAAGVNAPHRRDRIWFIAYAEGCDDKRIKREFSEKDGGPKLDNLSPLGKPGCGLCEERILANTIGNGQSGQGGAFYAGGAAKNSIWKASWSIDAGGWPIESPVCTGDDGLSLGLVDLSFSDWSEASLTALGNAIVPQIALELFKAIEQYELTAPRGPK